MTELFYNAHILEVNNGKEINQYLLRTSNLFTTPISAQFEIDSNDLFSINKGSNNRNVQL